MQWSTITLLALSAQIPAVLGGISCKCTGSAANQKTVGLITQQCCSQATFNGAGELGGDFLSSKSACDYTNIDAFKNVQLSDAKAGFEACCKNTNSDGFSAATGGDCTSS
ncbi:hypothetical protein MCOR27_001147 [Pyricularia oryzae]|uniref:Hydrophobin n=3 Tax=Pyricularia TaxID=48558 RepID=A0ABQ8P0I4_PYRGI|nr:uncharacterized protein MGG_09452 [Pyricularia oryzae 70-15]KAH8846263.1 hypothetical protein MCOR01_003464 [Pyricularia oryzae]KAI6304478.1 hypothetical protein MCOR33_000570 [Pyricularia grisea]EHA47783.1 hypothetical protein MGG_09452 [Pyricularia oryzae 70-15]KAH9432228.1 hypothetical protein MCOR02_006933 [Pyricularia oryzae]KAI6253097.1 hypothetical protein MCOR19_010315 [Pyricularia oryzae]